MFDVLNFSLAITDSRFQDPQAQKYLFDYDKRGLRLQYGDIQANLRGNRLTTLNKSLQGFQGTYRVGRLSVGAVRSEAKGSAKTISIPGNNSSGPYYLNASQIVRGSESIEVDGVAMVLGRDYIIDYELGAITFLNRIVSPTSTILATFEAFSFNADRGTIQGAAASYDLGAFGRVTVSAFDQRTGTGGGLSSRLEKFQGFGSPETPYFLQFEPLRTQPIIVKVDGVLQAENVDYYFDARNPVIFYFTRFMPPTSTIDVLYTPKPVDAVDGDRDVWGLEYRLPVGPNGRYGNVTYSQATGRLRNDVTPQSGTARGLDAILNHGRSSLRARVTDIPTGYVTVETRGFNRNERGHSMDFQYRASRNWLFGLGQGNTSVAQQIRADDGTIRSSSIRLNDWTAEAAFTPTGKGPTFRADHRHRESTFAGSTSRSDSSAATLNQQFGRWSTRFGYERQDATGRAFGTNERQRVQVNGFKVGANYGSERMTLDIFGSLSDVRTSGQSGKGTDVGITAGYAPTSNLNFSLGYQQSDSGSLAVLSQIDTGGGAGYNGNGFSGGIGNGFSTGLTDSRLLFANMVWDVTDRIAFDARVRDSRTSGSISSNTSNRSFGLGLGIDFGADQLLRFGFNRSDTRFLDSASTSSATGWDASFDGRWGRLSYRFGGVALLAGGTSPFRQDVYSAESEISYRLAARHRLAFSFDASSIRGYLPQSDVGWSASYIYTIMPGVGLAAVYRYRNVSNREVGVTTGAYRSSGFDLELRIDLGR
ncbi:MAG: hypothetical protein HONBIEJF_02209 [Fimbriimonadaceae bacterium]|nr:hypothetical protein [Fimbriimonadaceae bacterium]